MKIYLELFLVLNFILDFLLLYGTKKLLKRKTSVKRILLASIIGSISVLLLFVELTTVKLLITKIILSIFLILISFGIKNFFKNLTYFYLLSIILGGSLYLFEINVYALNYHLLLLITPLIIYFYIKENIKYKTIYSNNYVVEIYLDNNVYKLEGMIDTGNELKDPYKKRGVILVNLKIDYTKYKYLFVPYNALNTEGIIPCIKPDKVIIEDKVYKNYLIGLSKDKFNLHGVECILPNQFKEDLWKN